MSIVWDFEVETLNKFASNFFGGEFAVEITLQRLGFSCTETFIVRIRIGLLKP